MQRHHHHACAVLFVLVNVAGCRPAADTRHDYALQSLESMRQRATDPAVQQNLDRAIELVKSRQLDERQWLWSAGCIETPRSGNYLVTGYLSGETMGGRVIVSIDGVEHTVYSEPVTPLTRVHLFNQPMHIPYEKLSLPPGVTPDRLAGCDLWIEVDGRKSNVVKVAPTRHVDPGPASVATPTAPPDGQRDQPQD